MDFHQLMQHPYVGQLIARDRAISLLQYFLKEHAADYTPEFIDAFVLALAALIDQRTRDRYQPDIRD